METGPYCSGDRVISFGSVKLREIHLNVDRCDHLDIG